jgi:hypothetical protein
MYTKEEARECREILDKEIRPKMKTGEKRNLAVYFDRLDRFLEMAMKAAPSESEVLGK